MRPITDDVVHGLMKGLKTREKRALAMQAARLAAKEKPGNMTSKILSFAGSSGRKTSKIVSRNVLSFDDGFAIRKRARTTKGLFSYKSMN